MLALTYPATGDPLLIGEHPALDFLNSILAPHGDTLDHLYDGEGLRAWLRASQVLPPYLVQAVMLFSPAQMDKLASEARVLREAFRRLLVWRSEIGDAELVAQDLGEINTRLARVPLILVQEQGDNERRLTLHRDPTMPTAVIAELASVCVDLLVRHPQKQIHKCENPGCTLWFYDSKRGPRRRWCSMAICGNRMKVAAHRARARGKR